MKKLAKLLVGILILSISAFALGSCGDTSSACTHEWSEWKIVGQSNCKTPGLIRRECTKCGDSMEESLATGEHKYENYNCVNCGVTSAECFEFTYLEKTDSYSIKAQSNVDLPNEVVLPSYFNGKPVTTISADAFYRCSDLASVVIPDSVTSIGNYAFRDCTSLTSVVIGDSVTSIGRSAFSGCISLTELNLGNGVKAIPDCMAYGCNKLESIVIPDSVTTIGKSAFYGCSSLTGVVIPDSVTSIGNYAFWHCTSLTSVVIGDGVTSIGSFAFYSCSSLTSVVIGDNVTEIGGSAFYYCLSLASVYINDLSNWCNISFCDYDSNPLYYAYNLYVNGELVTELVIPDSVTSIGSYAFRNCYNLTSVVIGDSVTSIGSYAFRNCYNLTSVVIGDSVTSIGTDAFKGCSKLREVHNYSDLFIEKGSTNNGYVGYYAEVVIDY